MKPRALLGLTVGERIHALRTTVGISQRELATETELTLTKHVSYAYISRIESGTRNPSWSVLASIADVLDAHLWNDDKVELPEYHISGLVLLTGRTGAVVSYPMGILGVAECPFCHR